MITDHPQDSETLPAETRAGMFADMHPGYFPHPELAALFIRRYAAYAEAKQADNAYYIRTRQPYRVSPLVSPGRYYIVSTS